MVVKRELPLTHVQSNEPCVACRSLMARGIPPLCLLTEYNTLQRTTTHCNTLQHTATHTSCDKEHFERTVIHCNPSPRAALKNNRCHQAKKSLNDGGRKTPNGTQNERRVVSYPWVPYGVATLCSSPLHCHVSLLNDE